VMRDLCEHAVSGQFACLASCPIAHNQPPWQILPSTHMQYNHVIRIVTTSGDATEVFVGTQARLAYVGATLLILHLHSQLTRHSCSDL
jgi:hypothetical protein